MCVIYMLCACIFGFLPLRLDSPGSACEASRMAPRRSAPTDDEARKGVLYIRAEPELIAALDKEAQAISKAAGGLYVSRSNAARVVLRRALAHHLVDATDDTA